MEIVGVLFTFIMGTILHFAYDWFGRDVRVIIFSAVNESVWEHIKIFTMPYIIWAVIEMMIIRVPKKKFIVSKVLGVYMLSAVTIVFFYTYTSILGKHVLIIDIVSIFVWICLSYIISYKLTCSQLRIEKAFTLAMFAFAIFLSMYLSFTVNPPRLELFRDPITNTYGIQNIT